MKICCVILIIREIEIKSQWEASAHQQITKIKVLGINIKEAENMRRYKIILLSRNINWYSQFGKLCYHLYSTQQSRAKG